MTDRELAGCALLPCPFCGGHPRDNFDSSSLRHIECTTCMSSSGYFMDKNQCIAAWNRRAPSRDAVRLDYIERTFSGMTNRERYLPVQMIWGAGANGRTLREACDKYMKRDSAIAATDGGECV